MSAQILKVSSNNNKPGKPLTIPLVAGEFNASEARELVMNMLLDVQQYYQRRQFSQAERFGTNDSSAEKMVIALARAFDEARALVQGAENRGDHLVMHAHLKLETVSARSNSVNINANP